MPKVKIFTLFQNKHRDKVAKGLQRKGYSKSRSYKIATSQEKRRKRTR